MLKEDSKPGHTIGTLGCGGQRRDTNKDPSFTVQDQFDGVFGIKLNNEKDGILSLKVVSISSFTTKQASRQLEC